MGILVITGQQRSGTTALRASIAATGLFRNCSEVFHHKNSPTGETFRDFSRIKSLTSAATLTYADALQVANSYIDFLCDNTPHDQHIVMDVKYNYWKVIATSVDSGLDDPPFMSALKSRMAEFIFLRRRDLLSHRIAVKAKKWQNLIPEDVPVPFEIDLEELRTQCEWILSAETKFAACLNPYALVQHEWYEELFVDGMIRSGLREHLSLRFGFDQSLFRPSPINKNDIIKEKVIANYAQAQSVVEDVLRHRGQDRK